MPLRRMDIPFFGACSASAAGPYRSAVSSGRPSTASWATPCFSAVSASLPGPASSATTVCSRPPRIRPTSFASTSFGPNSTNTRNPASYISSTRAAKSTGFSSCSVRMRRFATVSAPYTAPRVFANTGAAGAATSTASTLPRNASTACPTNGVWNAADTGRREARTPASLAAAISFSTWAVAPPTTIWSGALRLQTTTPSTAASSSATRSSGADTAAMAPASKFSSAGGDIALPRARASVKNASSPKEPAAHRAVSSPKLWPRNPSAAKPSSDR